MRLDSDNPETMPITDAVYGKPPKRGKPGPAYEPREYRPLWRTVDEGVLTVLARRFPKVRRLAAQRRDA